MPFYYKVPAIIEYEAMTASEMDDEEKKRMEKGELVYSERIAQVRPDIPPDAGAYVCRRLDEMTFLVKTERAVRHERSDKIKNAATADIAKLRANEWHVPGVRHNGKNIPRRV